MKKQPLYPPHRIAEFPPCPWRALFAVLFILAIALVLSALSGCATPLPAGTGSTFESRQELRQTLRDLSRTVRGEK